MIYTKNQEEAINFKDGNLQIIACAGSGKTDVITRRIAILIKDGISPENILAFTFTEKAAEEMKLRTWQHLHGIMPNHPELGDMYVGTIHSFCFRLLQKYYPKYEAYDILDENKRNIFCYANFDKLKLSTFGKRTFEVVDKFSRSMDLVREELIDLEKLPYNFLDCYKAYLDLLNSEKFLDFSALMFETLKKLQEDSEFLDEVKNQYKYIIVDEYQDINKIQEYIIELIAGKNGNLCVVGDDDQCIYQWRGTDLKNILNFENRYENVKRIDNSINFRSSIAIVESAKNLIEGNSSRLEKKIEVWEGRKINYDEGDIYEVFFNNQNEEVEFIVDHIKHLVNTKFINNKGEIFTLSYQDIAIFFRSVKTSAEPYIKVFKKLQIPFIVKGGGKLFEQDEIKLIMYSLAYLGDIDYEKLEDSIKKCEKFYKQCFHGVGDVNKFITQLKDKKREISTVIFIRLQTLFSDLLNIIGAHEFELNETQFYNFGMFSQVISDFTAVYKRIKISQLIDFFAFIKGYGELNYEEGGLEDPTRINAVKIMTIHRAKGLQFPVIFIPNLVQGRFPSTAPSRGWYIPKNLFNFEKYEGTEEDERRLFYVAITRSEKYLFISASRRISGLSTNKRPSLFFREFPKDYAIIDDIEDPTIREKLEKLRIQSLKGFPTSFSDLRYYDRCPYDYKIRFIYGFNPEIPIVLGYGKSIHNILSILHTRYRIKPPTESEIKDVVRESFFLRYAPEDHFELLRTNVEESVINYVKKFSHNFELVIETEKSFEFLLEKALVSGVIDLVKNVNNSKDSEEIEVLDFKTHVSSSFAIDYEKQLKLYALAMQKALGITPKKATIHHLDDNTQTNVEITQNELDAIENEIIGIVENILNRNFLKKADSIKCKDCDWKSFCTK